MSQAEKLLIDDAPRHLGELPVGQRASVAAVLPQGKRRRRLLDLGLVPGTAVEIVRRSPGGNLTAINIRGAVIALRPEECRQVIAYTHHR